MADAWANGREQSDRAAGQGGEENDEFLRGHRHQIRQIASRKLTDRKRDRRQIESGGRTRDRTLDLSRVKATPRVDITRVFCSTASFPGYSPGFETVLWPGQGHQT